ncbi:MAG: hypothetical protein ACR2QC_04050 [Gammaproteobacteria bacterium]
MKIAILAIILMLFPFAAQAQDIPDLSDAAIGYQAEMTLIGNPQPQACIPSITGPSPFGGPDWRRCEVAAGGPSWQITHDALDLATCVALIPDFIANQREYERVKAAAASVGDPDMQYTGDCQCKGGGTTGC